MFPPPLGPSWVNFLINLPGEDLGTSTVIYPVYNEYKSDHRLSPPFSSLYVIITDRPGVPGFLGVSNSQTFCDKIIYGAINRRLAVQGFDEVYHKSLA